MIKNTFLLLVLSFSLITSFFWAQSAYAAEQNKTGKVIKENNNNFELSIDGKTVEIPKFKDKETNLVEPRVGDVVKVAYGPDGAAYIADYERSSPQYFLFAIFAAIVIYVGRKKGALSLLAMGLSCGVIIWFLVPQLAAGGDPIVLSLLSALIIAPITFYLGHGISRESTIALGATLTTLTLSGLLAYFFTDAARLAGTASDEANLVRAMVGESLNLRNLLLAGVILGSLGVLDDVTISQVSVVKAVAKANPKYTFWQLYNLGMSVGRDHIASLTNTLFLVYAGVSLPLFLLFYYNKGGFQDILNLEIVATEVIRTLVSSIAIVAAVPLTTLLAAKTVAKK